MTPVERLRAAIADLEQARYRSTPGPWSIAPHDETYAGITNPGNWITAGANFVEEPDLLRSDAELIVTLHRTIDAQLAILSAALERGTASVDGGGIERFVWSREHRAVALADAILGIPS